ncbi:GrpB family protein [Alkalihalobacillus sp. 1P02AB]|uniref:GrpB family protein n=1 Tax=Alkalihalobacillus sp. 1P02AB TaxID=3132260 RepID=UPI0039A6F6D8
MRKTNIQPYRLEWKQAYLEEEQLLKEIFNKEIIEIFHIGSTSVAAILYAKPIIDILIEVKDINNVEQKNQVMQQNGYLVKGENGISGRRYFSKGCGNTRTHHIHIYETGN